MSPRSEHASTDPATLLRLPVSLLTRYLFFLSRRPISKSNSHYLHQRLDGLKSFSQLLQGWDIPYLQDSIRQLEAMNPANFHRLLERVQFTLSPLTQIAGEIPHDVVVSNNPPQPDFFSSVRRVLLLLGPAIGIGDEITLFPLPTWIKRANPSVKLVILSAYQGLWNRVSGVDQVLYYKDYLSMLGALRGDPPFNEFDLVILADFEKPNLYPSICHEAKLERYIELSLGAQSLFVVDNRRRWLHRAIPPTPYFVNYYSGRNYLLYWLGLLPQTVVPFVSPLRRYSQPPTDYLRLYVNPYTSKYDPSESYWSCLLSSLFPLPTVQRIRFVIESGPNATTERYASALLRSARARTPSSVDFELTRPMDAPTLPFEGTFSQIERAHIVICSDSFSAHVAPLFGCTTLIVARSGLENWRAPYQSSYYFNASLPIHQVIAGMQQVLKSFGIQLPPDTSRPSIAEPESDLEVITRELQSLFDAVNLDDNFVTLYRTYHDFIRAYQEVVNRLPQWPPEFSGLFNDFAYQKSPHPLPNGHLVSDELKPDLILHLQDRWQEWHNTNLRKYLGLVLNGPTITYSGKPV